MSRALSTAAKASIFGQQTSEVWLILLQISHPSMGADLRYVNDSAQLVHLGESFNPFPFRVMLPEEEEERPPEVTLEIDNVDQSIVAALRALTTPPTVTVRVVMASAPDVVEAGPFTFELGEFSYDVGTVRCRLTMEPILNEPCPAGRYVPKDFPAMF